MLRIFIAGISLSVALVLGIGAVVTNQGRTAKANAAQRFSPYVDEDGAISLPRDFRANWAFLGSWSVAGNKPEEGAGSLHNVYTQPSTIFSYRKTGTFPDGAILVKEVLKTETEKMTMGTASWAGKPDVWFVMVKDAIGRFKGHRNWGDGWGWALFRYPDRKTQISKSYKADCRGCHLPARKDDWVYFRGYRVLEPQ